MTHVGRRGFVRASAVAAAAAMARPALAGPSQGASEDARVRRLKPLGKTGWRVGDISAGSGQRDPAVHDGRGHVARRLAGGGKAEATIENDEVAIRVVEGGTPAA